MRRLTLPLLALLLGVIMLASLSLGKYRVPAADLLNFAGWKLFGLHGPAADNKALLENILLNIRLPRILAAAMIGASLSVSGAAFQALFINPLVSPGLLGVLAGASFGAALGMVLSKSWAMVQLSTLAFGFVAVGAALGIAKAYRINSVIMLVLGGIISGAFFTAMLSIVKYAADPYNQLPAIVYWLMGNLSSVDCHTMLIMCLPASAGIIAIILHARQLNVLSMGEEEAKSLGINVARVRLVVIFFATLISAMTVMVGGMIGWVGLIIPHICRMIVGPNNEMVLPAAALIGAAYLVLADDVARLLFSYEIPTGIVTSLIGIPFFVLVLKNAQRGWR
ncbi:MAG: iron ABC transporter permease [Proteobacteria bacterium]|nr:iron ABC transporter permease [Pseudomonadota bacterium]MBU4295959.1 iron ABC transporter permease [Pseudomonadota bacterium]MCG2746169.1 iron ABC transporter permease [Desulfobulbaceae bacterium]